MVIARFEMDEEKMQVSLHLKGHAGQSVYGSDIVCSAASILAYTLAQNVKAARARGALKYEPRIKLNSGDAIISCRASDEAAFEEMLHTFLVIQTGYVLLAYNYPQYAACEMLGERETA